jgi:hypothetical protein
VSPYGARIDLMFTTLLFLPPIFFSLEELVPVWYYLLGVLGKKITTSWCIRRSGYPQFTN